MTRYQPDWKPIASAPKDGTAVLLCKDTDADGKPIRGQAMGIFIQVAQWWGDNEQWIVFCSLTQEPRLHFEPTHWAPIPNFPSTAAERLRDLRAMRREHQDRNENPWEEEYEEEAAELAELERAGMPSAPPPEKPQPLPTDWTPTMYLRFVSRETHVADSFPAFRKRMILQQGYVHAADGQRMWVDVPTMDE